MIKRLRDALLMMGVLAMTSILLGLINEGSINQNHLIGSLIAGFVLGFFLFPRLRKKGEQNKNTH